MADGGWGIKMFTWTKVAENLMKCLNLLKKVFPLFGRWDGRGDQNVHLNQSCRKFDEMPKSTKKKKKQKKTKKKQIHCWRAGGVKMFTWTKVAGNLMKCLNPLRFFFSLFGRWGEGIKRFIWTKVKEILWNALNPLKKEFPPVWLMGWTGGQKVAGNLMKCLNPLRFFFTVWPMGVAGEGIKRFIWTKVCRKFDEMH